MPFFLVGSISHSLSWIQWFWQQKSELPVLQQAKYFTELFLFYFHSCRRITEREKQTFLPQYCWVLSLQPVLGPPEGWKHEWWIHWSAGLWPHHALVSQNQTGLGPEERRVSVKVGQRSNQQPWFNQTNFGLCAALKRVTRLAVTTREREQKTCLKTRFHLVLVPFQLALHCYFLCSVATNLLSSVYKTWPV